jgi:hypothetical protein
VVGSGCAAVSRTEATAIQASTSIVAVQPNQQVLVTDHGVSSGGVPASGACPGVIVQPGVESRSGRALGQAILQVYARPDAEVRVDGISRGQTPLVALGVEAGPRDIELRNDTFGYACTFRLSALPGGRYSIQLDLEVAHALSTRR